MKGDVVQAVSAMRRGMQRAGPYLLIEIVLPGGTLLALLLLLYRQTRAGAHLRQHARSVVDAGRATRARWRQFIDGLWARAVVRATTRERDGLEPLGFATDW